MRKLFILLASVVTLGVNAQNQLLIRDNTPIDYSKIDVATVQSALDEMKRSVDQKIEAIIKVSSNQTVENTLMAYDRVQYEISDMSARIGLVSSVFSDDKTRDVAFEVANELQVYSNGIYLNDNLYAAFKKFNGSEAGKKLNINQRKFLNDVMISFEKNGMKLNSEDRKELTALNTKMIEFANKFDQNMGEHQDSVILKEVELKGLSAEDLGRWKQEDNTYLIRINLPNIVKILENAVNTEIRKLIYERYNNRAFPANISVLDSLLYYRDQYAKKLGFKSYAAYAVVDKMAATPEAVWAFENDLIKRLSPVVTKEVAEMKAFRDTYDKTNAGKELNAWDWAFYSKKMLNSKYALNTDEVTEYFEMNNTLQGMFSVYEKILGIRVVETKNVPLWNPKVKSYDMFKDGVKTGTFYLDLYPRPNKYNHFACFPISQYIKQDNKETLPVAALVCNFPEGSESQPSLLKHSDVITLFHEFGHLVHWELCHQTISSQNAFTTKGDFVEAPSQFLENWCWEYDALQLFAKHYKTGKALPQDLFNKMKSAQLFNSASQSIRQVYLGVTDFAYEDNYSEVKSKGVAAIAKEKFALSQLPFPEGTHFICSFTHLSGYGANYYGYLWSKVYAQDMFSVFKEKGVMNTQLGIKYRKDVLEKGSSENEKDLVEKFLGRKSNSDAFLKTLGIK